MFRDSAKKIASCVCVIIATGKKMDFRAREIVVCIIELYVSGDYSMFFLLYFSYILVYFSLSYRRIFYKVSKILSEIVDVCVIELYLSGDYSTFFKIYIFIFYISV